MKELFTILDFFRNKYMEKHIYSPVERKEKWTMKITNKNFEKKARDIMKQTQDAWYVDSIDESMVMNWTEVAWIKSLIDRNYSVTFKYEGAQMENKNNNQVWSPAQEKVISKMQTDISTLQTDVADIKDNIALILKHLGIKK